MWSILSPLSGPCASWNTLPVLRWFSAELRNEKTGLFYLIGAARIRPLKCTDVELAGDLRLLRPEWRSLRSLTWCAVLRLRPAKALAVLAGMSESSTYRSRGSRASTLRRQPTAQPLHDRPAWSDQAPRSTIRSRFQDLNSCSVASKSVTDLPQRSSRQTRLRRSPSPRPLRSTSPQCLGLHRPTSFTAWDGQPRRSILGDSSICIGSVCYLEGDAGIKADAESFWRSWTLAKTFPDFLMPDPCFMAFREAPCMAETILFAIRDSS